MNHSVKIGVSSETPADGGIVHCVKLDLRERLLRLLFGKRKRLTILIPGDSVQTLSIYKEGRNENDT